MQAAQPGGVPGNVGLIFFVFNLFLGDPPCQFCDDGYMHISLALGINSGCESSLHKKACYPKQQRALGYSQLQPSILFLSLGAI